MSAQSFQFSSFLVRFCCALVLVFLSYNPSGYSFTHWVNSEFLALPVLVLIGIILLIGWVIFLRATLRSLGPIGITLAGLFFGCLAWVAIYYNLLTVGSTIFVYIVLVIVSAILALGMSWSHVRRRISGQVDMDDIDQ
jgi:Na+/melibiose symporter-like transporter